ncbi:MAG TPA: SDR family oxidoreductase, partial [Solirubrobacterales bacterium]|nr:SDR family oxidoreductase [Solirubrobacterales bacterium]
LGIAADVTDPKATAGVVEEAVKRFGGLDVVVANAGIAPPGLPMLNTDREDWERVLDVNLLGVWRTVRPALPQIAERGGQVVLLGSIYSYANGFMASPYAVSKAAIEALGRALRAELSPLGASATVVYFGWVDTKMVQGSLDEKESGRRMKDSVPAFVMKRITPGAAAATLVRAVEQRSPRAFAPGWWRYYAALRGLLNPLLDRRMESEPNVRAAILAEGTEGSGPG